MAEHNAATTRALAKIDRLDLEYILAKAAKDFRWNDKRAVQAELWYKRFLKLCYLHRRKPVAAISRNADQLWHYHILDTARYQRDSRALFGNYLNHQPRYRRATPEEREAFKESLEMYKDEYASLPIEAVAVCWRPPAPPPAPPGPPGG